MGNLGSYQDIVTEAHRAGGVEQLIESIEKAAAARAMPRAFAAGALVTGVLAVGAGAVVKVLRERMAAREAKASEAKARLADAIDAPTTGAQPDTGQLPNDPFASGSPS